MTVHPEFIMKGRFNLGRKRRYLAAAIYSMRFVSSPNLGTMGMDKWGRLYYDPELKWSDEEVVTVLEHEVWHFLRRHADRFEHAPIQLANIATDLEINDGMIENGAKFPGDPLTPSKFGFEDHLTAEEYYQLLPKSTKAKGDCGSVVGGGQRPWEMPGDSKASPGMTKTKAEAIRQRVANDIRDAGNVGGDADRWAESILDPGIDPAKLLRKFVSVITSPGSHDSSWLRPNKRHDGDMILPGYIGRPRADLVFLIDTSGSMGENDLGLALGTIKKAMKGGNRIKVFLGDTRITGETCPKKITDMRDAMKGGGGTDMAGIITDLDTKPGRKKPIGLIVLTDGYTGWPAHRPSFPTAVLITVPGMEGNVPAWAKTIVIGEGK